MFFSSNAANFVSDTSLLSNIGTPPHHLDAPTDLETEDGIPFGRSHHVERFLQHHENGLPQQSPHCSAALFAACVPLHHNSPHRQSPSNYPLTSIFLHLPCHMALLLLHSVSLQACVTLCHPLDDQLTWSGSKGLWRRKRSGGRHWQITPKPFPNEENEWGHKPSWRRFNSKFQFEHRWECKFSWSSCFKLPVSAGSHSKANDNTNISIGPFASCLQDGSILPYNQSHSISSAHDELTNAANLSVGASEGNLSKLETELHCSDEVKALQFLCRFIWS